MGQGDGGRREVAEMPRDKKLNLTIRGDLIPWISYAAGLRDTSMTQYINDAVERDRDGADEATAEGYRAFMRARGLDQGPRG